MLEDNAYIPTYQFSLDGKQMYSKVYSNSGSNHQFSDGFLSWKIPPLMTMMSLNTNTAEEATEHCLTDKHDTL